MASSTKMIDACNTLRPESYLDQFIKHDGQVDSTTPSDTPNTKGIVPVENTNHQVLPPPTECVLPLQVPVREETISPLASGTPPVPQPPLPVVNTPPPPIQVMDRTAGSNPSECIAREALPPMEQEKEKKRVITNQNNQSNTPVKSEQPCCDLCQNACNGVMIGAFMLVCCPCIGMQAFCQFIDRHEDACCFNRILLKCSFDGCECDVC